MSNWPSDFKIFVLTLKIELIQIFPLNMNSLLIILMSQRCLKTSDHDLDLQCQIGLETNYFMYFLV